MALLLSLVTEDDILEKSNEITKSESRKMPHIFLEDPKARRSLRAAMQGRALLQRITEEKKHD